MKKEHKNISEKSMSQFVIPLIIIALLIGVTGCYTMTVIEKDESAGLNGGFEIVKEGLPVNWFFISPTALKEKVYELMLDTTSFKEGKQSLKFLVHGADSLNIWNNAGMFSPVDAIPGETYQISFWLKNNGCGFTAKVRSENHPLEHDEIIIQSNDNIIDWQFFEYNYRVPSEYDRLGFYLHIWEPGSLWIEDVSIEKIDG
jgi:hypothetical protein